MTASICSVCNGLEPLAGQCPDCGKSIEDQGKLSDFYGPYSPYRPIDDLKMTNGYLDLETRICMHCAYCPSCGKTFPVAVQEHF